MEDPTGSTTPDEPTALEMAENLIKSIPDAARFAQGDPFGAMSGRTAEKVFSSAELASRLAMVSLARDVHEIRDDLRRIGGLLDQLTRRRA